MELMNIDSIWNIMGDSYDYKREKLEKFIADKGLTNLKSNYKVICFSGSQSSGISTLSNASLGTWFKVKNRYDLETEGVNMAFDSENRLL